MAESHFFSNKCRAQRALDHRLNVDFLRFTRLGASRIVVHQRREQILVERPPVHAYSDGLVVVERHLDDRSKILVAPFPAHISRVDSVFREGFRRFRILHKQQMTVVVEIPDHRDCDVHISEPARDLWHRAGCIVVVDRYAHQPASSPRQFSHLESGPGGISRIRIRHGLHNDWVGGPDRYASYHCSPSFPAGDYGQWFLRVLNLKANSPS